MPVEYDEDLLTSTLLERAQSSSVPFRNLSALMAAAQLDDNQPPERRIGYMRLFEATCDHGRRHWLDPMPHLGEINEILRRFLAPRDTISPVIEILGALAARGISPFAFLDYVILPRLREDRNWRRWKTAHLPVIRALAVLLTRLRSAAPYHTPGIGSTGHSVKTDVFLVKYVAAALAGRTVDEMDRAAMEAIESAWRKLTLESRAMILFLRMNARPVLARLGKRLDIIRYLEIIEMLPAVETALNGHESWLDGNRVYESGLYGQEPGREIQRRESAGFKAIHFLREFRAYLDTCVLLLDRPGGRFALTYAAGAIRRAADAETARRIRTLVGNIADQGGRHIYIWHIRALLALPDTGADRWIDAVRTGGGAHPDYPRYDRLFAHDEFRRLTGALREMSALLEIPAAEIAPIRSPRELLRAYAARHPEVDAVI